MRVVVQEVENFPGFPDGILGSELTDRFRAQSVKCGAEIRTETVTQIDLSSRPFKIYSDTSAVEADAVIIATGAVARRMTFPGSGEDECGFWNKGISACAVCDGAAPIFRNKALMVVGGGDTAMEEASFLSRYASQVYIVHRRDELRASKHVQLCIGCDVNLKQVTLCCACGLVENECTSSHNPNPRIHL